MLDGEKALAAIRTKVMEGKFLDIAEPIAKAPKQYNPKYWRLVGRYWHYRLQHMKAADKDRSNLKQSLKKFGARYARQVFREDILSWREELRAAGYEVATVNAAFKYLRAAYGYANSENNPKYRLDFNPAHGMAKMPGEKVRMFLLTPEQFEKNYQTLMYGRKWPNGNKPDKHMTLYQTAPAPRFALFYLALWETGRRPVEVSQYTWEMVTEREVKGCLRHMFMVPPEITKTEEPEALPISERLWHEMSRLAYRQGWVFRNEDGNRWRGWKRHIAKLKRLYGPAAGWCRDTRRAFCTRKVEDEGFAPAHVKEISGHKTYSVFDRYRIGKLDNKFSVVDGRSTNCTQMGKTG